MEQQIIQSKIFKLRGQRVMLDFDLAEMYGIATKRLKEAIKRSFSADFVEVTKGAFTSLNSQIATSKKGGTRYLSFAFTEKGEAMLSSVLSYRDLIGYKTGNK